MLSIDIQPHHIDKDDKQSQLMEGTTPCNPLAKTPCCVEIADIIMVLLEVNVFFECFSVAIAMESELVRCACCMSPDFMSCAT
jgi:hypothetical protein